jgi:cytochrome c7-like protein
MPTGTLRAVLLLTVVLAASVAARAQGTAGAPPARPAAPVQPLPYSHKTHVALGLQCRNCHVNPEEGKLMTYPAAATCMTCHATVAADRPTIKKLAALATSGAEVPWVRVYKLPDYVYWTHATHIQSSITCEECHGPVAQREVIAQETNIVTMAGCMSCHNKRQVLTDCGDCHAPRQLASGPRGRMRATRATLLATM